MGRSTKAAAPVLQIGDGAPTTEVFTAVAEITSFGDLPTFGVGTVETTSFDSTAEEFEGDGIQAPGEITVEVNWLPTHATQNEATGALAKARAGAKCNWKIVVQTGVTATPTKTYAFAAFVSFTPSIGAVKDKLSAKIKLKITGAVVPT